MEYEVTDGRRGDETLAQQPPRESIRVRRPPYRNSGYKPSDDAMYDTGDYSVSDLAEVFSVSRPTVYRTLQRQPTAT